VFRCWGNFNTYYKGEVICAIRLPKIGHKIPWAIALHLNHADKYKDLVISEGLQHVFFDNIVYCVYGSNSQPGTGCGQSNLCAGEETRTILGIEIKGVCHRSQKFIPFFIPDETAKNGIKRLLELEQKARDEVPKKIIKQADVQKSAQNEQSPVEKPMNIRRNIENDAVEFLENEKQKNMLDFVAWLKKNKMPPVWGSYYSWKSSFKGKGMCYLGIDPSNGSWNINPYIDGFEDENALPNEQLKEMVWSRVDTCKICGCSCWPGNDKTILGKHYENVCGQFTLLDPNPDVEEIESAKQLILAKRGL